MKIRTSTHRLARVENKARIPAGLERRICRGLDAWKQRWLERCSSPLSLIHADGTETVVGPPEKVEISPPLTVRYIWDIRPEKPVVAVRFGGTGRPIRMGICSNHLTWESGIE